MSSDSTSPPSCAVTFASPLERAALDAQDDTPETPIETLFGIDLRSLALFRVVAAVLILADLFLRAQDMRAHYTDAGVLPRADLMRIHSDAPTLHAVFGGAWFEWLMFGVAAFVGSMLLVGYRTRIATAVSWVLMISLQMRNPDVLQAGDILFRVMLFWGMFLPLGARWSIDSAMNTTPVRRNAYATTATFAMLMQVCIVYWFTAIFKWHPIWHRDGQAVYYALNLDGFATSLGVKVRQYPELMRWLTLFTYWTEALGPFLAFIPIYTRRFRMLAVVLFIGMHIGFASCMRLGLFGFVSMMTWLIFIPGGFWDWLFARLRRPALTGLKIYYDGDCGFCLKMVKIIRTFLLLPETPLIPAQSDAAIHEQMKQHNSWVVVGGDGVARYKFDAMLHVFRVSPVGVIFWPLLALPISRQLGTMLYERVAGDRGAAADRIAWIKPRPMTIRPPWITTAFVAAMFVYVVAWNFRTLDIKKYGPYYPAGFNSVNTIFRVGQMWNMFSPYPRTSDGWYVIPAQLRNGREVDLFRGGIQVNWEKPDYLIADDYPNQHWRKYMTNLSAPEFKNRRLLYLNYLAREWNARHKYAEQVSELELWWVEEMTKADRIGEPEPKLLWHWIFDEPKGAKPVQKTESGPPRPSNAKRPPPKPASQPATK